MDKLFIPDRINVGYQEHSGTYTGRLAYVIYWDKKGVLRKETSWQSWRDKAIDATEAANTPTEGFVLNKGGGGGGGWHHRNEFIRVYDPRGWEVEISVANLLYVLLHCDCLRGKGLEGRFVYAWQGTELVLLPEGTAEYTASAAHTERQGMTVAKSTLQPGITYTTKDGTALIFIGNLPYHTVNAKPVKRLVFYGKEYGKDTYIILKDTKKLSEAGDTVSPDLPELTRGYLRGLNGSRVLRLFLKEGSAPKGERNFFAFERGGVFCLAEPEYDYSEPKALRNILVYRTYAMEPTGILRSESRYDRYYAPGTGSYWQSRDSSGFCVPTGMQLHAEMESGSTIRISTF